MIAMRLKPFFKSIDMIKEKNIMFVTHAVTMRLIRACLEKHYHNILIRLQIMVKYGR